jgi:hypothetical protein
MDKATAPQENATREGCGGPLFGALQFRRYADQRAGGRLIGFHCEMPPKESNPSGALSGSAFTATKALRCGDGRQRCTCSSRTGPRYRVTLLQQEDGGSTHVVGTVAGLALSPHGYVHCYADAIRLRPGSYLLRIDGDTESPATALTFRFNLRAGGGDPTRRSRAVSAVRGRRIECTTTPAFERILED